MKLSSNEIISFQTMIFSWWKNNKRDLPWRRTRDPYAIHVSEVMLQQTQVSRVLPTYQQFLQLFPNVETLASASTSSVLVAWKGMGYNRRALYLKRTAVEIVQKYHKRYPQQEKDLLALPGLGKYTARAILVFAYEQQLAFIDTNIRQIIEQHFFEGIKQKESEIQSIADQLLPQGRAWDWHQALMDFGSATIKQSTNRSLSDKKMPFKDTNRFIRGRIIDMVRDQDWEETELLTTFQDRFQKEPNKVIYNLNNLIQEGLLQKNNQIIKLPD
jgi:A/G-specific adenine glycosylase